MTAQTVDHSADAGNTVRRVQFQPYRSEEMEAKLRDRKLTKPHPRKGHARQAAD